MGKKFKGTSRLPATDKALDFWLEPSNRDAGRMLSPLLSEIAKSGASWAGVRFSALLTILWSDPAAIAAWERESDGADQRRMLVATRKLCRLLADAVAARYGPDTRLEVKIPKRDVKRSPSEWQDEHNRDNSQKRSEASALLHRAIRKRHKELSEEHPDWSDSRIRGELQAEFGDFATKGNDTLSRETINAALRDTGGSAA